MFPKLTKEYLHSVLLENSLTYIKSENNFKIEGNFQFVIEKLL